MRKLLYAFAFASILVLAGFTSFASENEPGGGGTLPPNRVWLPVVAQASIADVYPYCPYEVTRLIAPSNGEVFPIGTNVYFEFDVVLRGKIPPSPRGRVIIYEDKDLQRPVRGGSGSSSETITNVVTICLNCSEFEEFSSGRYYWQAYMTCVYPKGGHDGPPSVDVGWFDIE